MKKVYECYIDIKYKKLIFTDFYIGFYRYILAENKEDALSQYRTLIDRYDLKPYGARKILEQEYVVNEYKCDLSTLKEEMNYEDYLEMINERISNKVDPKII